MLKRPASISRCLVAVTLLTALAGAASARAELVYVNGIGIELRSLAVRGDPRAAALQLAGRWRHRQQDSPVTLVETGDGLVVGRQRGAIHETALFKQGPMSGMSQVTVSATHVGLGARAVPAPPFVLPRGLRLLSVVESGVGGDVSAEFVLVADRTLPLMQVAVRSAAEAAGWTVQSAAPLRASRKAESLVVVMRPLPRGLSLVIQHRRNVGS